MCAGLTSKCYLGVTLCAAALLGVGGCISQSAAPAEASRPDPSGPPEPGYAGPTVGDRDAVASAVDTTPPPSVPSVEGPAPLSADAAAPETPVSQTDIIAWVTRGTADDVILDRIQHAHTASRLTAGDELRLRDAGVTDQVIRAMRAAAWN